MIRYNIYHGDKTTAGGTVIASAHNFRLMGRSLALIGDDVLCQQCGKAGKIGAQGPRLTVHYNGRGVALNGDICLCGCTPSPQLINSQTMMKQTINSDQVARHGYGAGVGIALSPSLSEAYDDQYQLLDMHTNQPLARVEYAIKRASGDIERGTTDSKGYTHRLAKTVQSEEISIYCNGIEHV